MKFLQNLMVIGWMACVPIVHAQEVAGKQTAPDLERRVADLEAYMNNTARGSNAAEPRVTSNISGPGPGDNAWMMTSTALVLFMALPGLALYHGGLVRRKNVLSVLAQCVAIAGLVTIIWWAVGYSLVFSPGSPFLGGLKYAFLNGVDSNPNPNYSYWVSQNVYAMYQMMFAIVTPSLIVGAIAERMKFQAFMLFITLWMLVVYIPLAHMVWGAGGMMNGIANASAPIKAIDFSGGMVVHMSSGWSALILCLILGKRIGLGHENMAPHSLVLSMAGTCMLWVGWYGFNAGGALAADGIAANAFMTTTLATAVASSVWGIAEWFVRGKPSMLGFCSGVAAGLVVITPACGYVNATGAILIGVSAGIIPFFAVIKLKAFFGYDDALDTFGLHAVGGTLGVFLTGILARLDVNRNLSVNLKEIVGKSLWLEQLKAMGVTLTIAIVGTVIIAYTVRLFLGLRTTPEAETIGLDLADHGEEGYLH